MVVCHYCHCGGIFFTGALVNVKHTCKPEIPVHSRISGDMYSSLLHLSLYFIHSYGKSADDE